MNKSEMLNEKIEAKIEEMEQKDYCFAKRFSRKDYLVWLIAIVICFLFILYGATL